MVPILPYEGTPVLLNVLSPHAVDAIVEEDAVPNTEAYWQAWFDGSALPNPGKIGVGALVMAPNGTRFEQSALAGCSGCNNEAELHALCAVLKLAHEAGARRLVVHGDSDVVMRYVVGPDTTEVARLVTLIASAREWLPRFEDIRLIWIPRHRNREADRYSRQALGLADKPAAAPKCRRRRR